MQAGDTVQLIKTDPRWHELAKQELVPYNFYTVRLVKQSDVIKSLIVYVEEHSYWLTPEYYQVVSPIDPDKIKTVNKILDI